MACEAKKYHPLNSIIISQCGAFHAWPAAQAAFRQGWLQQFVTTRPVRDCVPRDKIRDLAYLEFPLRILRYLNGRLLHSDRLDQIQKKGVGSVKKFFDGIAAAEINRRTRIFHLFSVFQENAVRRCEEYGVKKVMDYGTAHSRFFREILMREAESLGIKLCISGDQEKDNDDEMARMDALCIPSRFVERSFRESGYLLNNLVWNGYGVDTDFFRPAKNAVPGRKSFRIMTAGMLGIRKGTLYLLQAVERLARSGMKVELYLMGNPDAEFYNRVMKEYAGCITHMGTVDHRDLPGYYSSADVFVLPSLVEGQARAVLEAMACGTPCIVTPNTGHEETIRDGINGFLVPIRDSRAIEDRISILIRETDRRIEMGRQARLTAEQHTWAHYQARLMSIYDGFLKTAEPRSKG